MENRIVENWKQINGYLDYEVSDLGNVRSLKCNRVKILKKCLNQAGYHKVNLHNFKKQKVVLVHKLVAEMFLNYTPIKGFVIDHLDDDKLNNALTNLKIVTHRKNLSRRKNNTSKYAGVSMLNIKYKWVAAIQINHKDVHLGKFMTEIEAHESYQKALSYIHLYENDNKKFRSLLNQLP